jgi:ABC-type microcin C transport system permease subunit YejE
LLVRLNPLTARKLRRFREIKRGYYSFILLVTLTVLSLFAELLINDKPLIISYDGQLTFPTYSAVRLGVDFGLGGDAANVPVDYRDLQRRFREADNGDFVVMPLVPYNPYENSEVDGIIRSTGPNMERQHYLGTDTTGRDILARLFYGFRTAILFSIAFTVLTYLIGIALGCMMGYFGGIFDLLFQRIIEIWSNIPFLYMVIIVFSVIPATFSIPTRITILLVIMVLFSWTFMTYYMRTETYREKARDYALAYAEDHIPAYPAEHDLYRGDVYPLYRGGRDHRHHRSGLPRLGPAAAYAQYRRVAEAGHREPDNSPLDRDFGLRRPGPYPHTGYLHRRGDPRGLRWISITGCPWNLCCIGHYRLRPGQRRRLPGHFGRRRRAGCHRRSAGALPHQGHFASGSLGGSREG